MIEINEHHGHHRKECEEEERHRHARNQRRLANPNERDDLAEEKKRSEKEADVDVCP